MRREFPLTDAGPPPMVRYPGRRRLYRFQEMAIDAAFFVPVNLTTDTHVNMSPETVIARRLRASARYHGVKIVTRAKKKRVGGMLVPGVMVWRTA